MLLLTGGLGRVSAFVQIDWVVAKGHGFLERDTLLWKSFANFVSQLMRLVMVLWCEIFTFHRFPRAWIRHRQEMRCCFCIVIKNNFKDPAALKISSIFKKAQQYRERVNVFS